MFRLRGTQPAFPSELVPGIVGQGRGIYYLSI